MVRIILRAGGARDEHCNGKRAKDQHTAAKLHFTSSRTATVAAMARPSWLPISMLCKMCRSLKRDIRCPPPTEAALPTNPRNERGNNKNRQGEPP
jgi:hypothetical protein